MSSVPDGIRAHHPADPHLTHMTRLQPARKRGRKFLNPVQTEMGGLSVMLKALPLYLTNKAKTEPKVAPGPFHTDGFFFRQAPVTGVRITWFGHSSVLLEIDGVRLLIDPVWDERASPVSFAGPRRFFAPTLALEDLPPLDAVLLSHDHFDHLGEQTVKRLSAQRPELRWVCPLAVGKVLTGFGVAPNRITELDWTQSVEITGQQGGRVKLTALPARHFSGRSVANRFKTLWASYAIAGPNHKIYYGADSGLWDGFTAIAETYGPFDLSMLEIGAYHPLWEDIHMGPDGAAQAFAELGGGVLMPVHWGLFNLALHAWTQPIERMEQLADEQNVKLFAPEPGLPTDFHPATDLRSAWWKPAVNPSS